MERPEDQREYDCGYDQHELDKIPGLEKRVYDLENQVRDLCLVIHYLASKLPSGVKLGKSEPDPITLEKYSEVRGLGIDHLGRLKIKKRLKR